SATVLSSIADRIKSNLSARTYIAPAGQLSPQLFLDRVKPNALAPYLAPLYEMFFRAEDPEKIELILDQAYVDTAELREYDLVLRSRGSGKTLFIARFFSHLMSESLKKNSVWCVVDFNRAPSSIDNIEDYICEKFLE